MILLDRYRIQGKRIHAHLVDPVYRVYGTGRAVCDRFVELIARIMPEGDADRVSVEFTADATYTLGQIIFNKIL